MRNRNRVLVVLGSGGHTTQMLRLIDLLGPRFDYSYLLEKEDELSEDRIRVPGPVYRVHKPDHFGDPVAKKALKTLRTSLESIGVFLKAWPDMVISCGPGTALPISVLARLLGGKVIFIESASRVYTRSMTGRLIYPFAHLFFVQWEELKSLYPKAVYEGRLL